MTSKHKNFETRKSVHINLSLETHAAFRMCTFQHHLSMQEIFEEVSVRIVEGDPYMLEMLGNLEERKRLGKTRKMAATDAETIFKAIAADDPLETQNSDSTP